MKFKLLSLLIVLTVFSCKNEKTDTTISEEDVVTQEEITTSIYPESITKVFDAHGGVDTWNTMKTLSFTMERPNGMEVTTTHLKNRNERIETPNYTAGYDGENYWVVEKDGKEYKGNMKFYKGLMMYFYAMPFIVSDDGIMYEEAEPLTFEGKTYPGILVSYEDGVGVSSDDEYIIYYDEATGQMEWLGYTVTYGKDGKSDDFHFIRYNNWQTVNGLVVPKSMDWYNYDNGLPTTKRNTVEFIDVSITKDSPDSSLFETPDGARVIE